MATSEATYGAFDRAFANVSASCIMEDGQAVGRICFKRGNSVTCFFQLWGSDMMSGRAGGGGYDRDSAALERAAEKLRKAEAPRDPVQASRRELVIAALLDPRNDGRKWDQRLERIGFTVSTVID